MFSKKVTLIGLLLFFAQSSFAGDAGCGLGSLLISKNSKGLQLLAMTTNASFLSQPLGITSGTSGCSASGIVNNDKEIQYFVEVNQEELSRQMAEGQGTHLNTLASLMGCQTSQGQTKFATEAQANYSAIVTRQNIKSTEMVENISAVMNHKTNVLSACRGS